MKAKKQQNGNAKVKAPKGDAVVCDPVAVTIKKKDRKRQSTEASQALPAKIIKKQEGPVLSAVAKSKKRKNRKKKTAAAATGDAKPVNLGRERTPKDEGKEKEKQALSIAYLKLWKEDRTTWKFKKIHQMWLNDNVFNSVMVPDNMFPIWLEYMTGSTEGQKLWLVKRSTETLEQLEAANSTVDAGDVKYQRAKKIIQTLQVEKKEDSEEDEDEEEEEGDSST